MELQDQLQQSLGDFYRLKRELPGGGMSRVFVADEIALGREIVIKVLLPQLAATLNIERFRREVQFAARLQHACIVPVLAGGISDGLPYFTMPLVEGQSLRDRIAKTGPLPIAEIVHVLRDVLGALSYAHEHGVVHRDIKPANVLLSRHHALVLDFGVAKALSESANIDNLTSPGIALGTPGYMAPEQAAADPAADHRADLYSVGALAYEMLTGRMVFVHRSPQATLAAQMFEAPQPVEQLQGNTPPELAALVMSALEKDPADRPQSAEEMLQQLESVPVPVLHRLRRPALWGRRPSMRSVVVAAALGAVVVLAAAAMMLKSRGLPKMDPKRVIVAPFQNKSGDASLDTFGPVATEWITRALTEAGMVEVVPLSIMESQPGAARTSADMARLRIQAQKGGAQKIVLGSYFLEGDSLGFEAVIADAATGAIVNSVPTSRSARSDPMPGIEALRTRVAAVLAGGPGSEMSEVAGSDAPPSFPAYREFLLGENAAQDRDWAQAVAHYRRAAELDTSFLVPLVRADYALINLDQCARADSVGAWLAPRRQRLSSFEGHVLDGVLAWCRGDPGAAYRSGRRLLALAPRSTLAIYVAARTAMYINRLHEALGLLEGLDPQQKHSPWYYDTLCLILHGLGNHDRELAVATAERELYKADMFPLRNQARALGALGRMQDLNRLVDESLTMPTQSDFSPPRVILTGTLELQAHGYPGDARALAGRLARWYQRRPVDMKSNPRQIAEFAQALCLAGRCSEARPLTNMLVAAAPTNRFALREHGLASAQTGDREAAIHDLQLLAHINDRYSLGRIKLIEAQITAMLGDRRHAFELLQEAIAEGVSFQEGFNHAEYGLDSLRDYPPFKALLKSRD